MEEVDEFLSAERSRREVLAGAGSAAVAALAGCSGNVGDETPVSTETDSDTENEVGSEPADGTEEADPTEETSTTDNQTLEQYEDDEPEMEAQYEEERRDSILFNWMEFENPEEQIPQENYSLEEFPTLQILQYEGGGEDGNDAYDPENETVYLGWLEKDGKMALDVAVIYEWGESLEESELHSEVSTEHTEDVEADIKGILRDVIEGYNEISDNMEEEYRELL